MSSILLSPFCSQESSRVPRATVLFPTVRSAIVVLCVALEREGTGGAGVAAPQAVWCWMRTLRHQPRFVSQVEPARLEEFTYCAIFIILTRLDSGCRNELRQILGTPTDANWCLLVYVKTCHGMEAHLKLHEAFMKASWPHLREEFALADLSLKNSYRQGHAPGSL